MSKALRLLGKFTVSLFTLAALLLGCRFVCPRLGWPDWTAWAAAGAGVGVAAGAAYLRSVVRAVSAAKRAGRDGEWNTPNPDVVSRSRAAWRQGRRFLRGDAGRLPWYIALGTDDRRRKRILNLAAVPGTECAAPGEFSWHFAQKAVWLDLDFGLRREDDGRWRLFLGELGARRGPAGVGGVVAALDAKELLSGDDATLKADAGLLRSRLDQLMRAVGADIPTYLLVNRIDLLYGARSLAAKMDRDELARPLGSFALGASSPAALVGQAVRSATARLSATVRRHPATPGTDAGLAASIQAPDELARLVNPLIIFCEEAFASNPYQKTPRLRGLFFGSTGPKGDTIAPLLAGVAAFRPEREPAAPARQWFWTNLIRQGIPGDGSAAAAPRAGKTSFVAHSGLAGLMAGTLVLCWLMTASFLESRRALLSAYGKTAEPRTAEELEACLELGEAISRRIHSRWLPRLGMNQPLALERELRRRYNEAYRELKIAPSLSELEDRSLAAASSRDAAVIGDVLLELAALRRELSRCLGLAPDDGGSEFLHSLRKAAHPEKAGDVVMLLAYFGGAERQNWMSAARENLAALQKHILDNAMGGDVAAWLPLWIAKAPGMRPVDTADIWAPAAVPAEARPRRRIGAAWTRQGYQLAEAFLEALDCGETDAGWPGRKSAALDQYRRDAMTAWKRAAEEIWSGFQDNIADGDVPALIRLASEGDHPAARFSRLARQHLPAMSGREESVPGLVWLQRHDDAAETAGVVDTLLGSLADLRPRSGDDTGLSALSRDLGLEQVVQEDSLRESGARLRRAFHEMATLTSTGDRNLETVRDNYRLSEQHADLYASVPAAGGRSGAPAPSDPFALAWMEAGEFEYRLANAPGTGDWTSVSPLAVYDYLRYLSTRRAALDLDRLWQDQVYRPSRFLTGGEERRRERIIGSGGLLETFLATSALGLWDYRNNRLDNATWDRLSFMFNREFLDYCNWALAKSGEEFAGTVPLTVRVEAAGVDIGARERPHSLEIVWRENGGEQKLLYRNYQATAQFAWNRNRSATAAITITFPSITVRKEFTGQAALADFVRAFAGGVFLIESREFPAQQDALRRLGISKIAVKADMPQAEEFLRQYTDTIPVMPRSIITPGGGASQTTRAHAGLFNRQE